MDRVQRLVRAWIAAGREDEVRETVTGTRCTIDENLAGIETQCTEIMSGSASLLDVVKALGEYLTAEDDKLRTKGAIFMPYSSTFLCTIV